MAYSYSSIKVFSTCPLQYYETKVLKKHKTEKTEAIIYGEQVHLALEEYVKDKKPLGKHEQFQPIVDNLNAMAGDKITEMKMAVNRDLQPVDFFADDVWFRGIADLTIINNDTAKCFDYKSGKDKYPDIEQLEIMALLIFAHFPAVNKVRAALIFLLYNNVVPKKGEVFSRIDYHTLWAKWIAKTERIEAAMESGVWNMKPSGLCSWCCVKDCINWKQRK